MNLVAKFNSKINRDIPKTFPKITGDRNYRRKHLICINSCLTIVGLVQNTRGFRFYIVHVAYQVLLRFNQYSIVSSTDQPLWDCEQHRCHIREYNRYVLYCVCASWRAPYIVPDYHENCPPQRPDTVASPVLGKTTFT